VNYAQWIAPAPCCSKDGGLLTAWHFAGPDLALAAPEELERLAAQANAALARCGSGWMLHVDVICRDHPSLSCRTVRFLIPPRR